MRFQEFMDGQEFSPMLIAAALRTTKSEIASTLGLGKDAFSRASQRRGAQVPGPIAADDGTAETR